MSCEGDGSSIAGSSSSSSSAAAQAPLAHPGPAGPPGPRPAAQCPRCAGPHSASCCSLRTSSRSSRRPPPPGCAASRPGLPLLLLLPGPSVRSGCNAVTAREQDSGWPSGVGGQCARGSSGGGKQAAPAATSDGGAGGAALWRRRRRPSAPSLMPKLAGSPGAALGAPSGCTAQAAAVPSVCCGGQVSRWPAGRCTRTWTWRRCRGLTEEWQRMRVLRSVQARAQLMCTSLTMHTGRRQGARGLPTSGRGLPRNARPTKLGSHSLWAACAPHCPRSSAWASIQCSALTASEQPAFEGAAPAVAHRPLPPPRCRGTLEGGRLLCCWTDCKPGCL